MKEMMKNISYDLYLIVLGTLAFFSFTGKIADYIILIYVGIGLLAVMAKKSVFYILPIALFMTMSTTELRDDITSITIFAIVISIVILIDIFRNRKFKKLGYLFLPFLIFVILSVFSSMNAIDGFTPFVGFALSIVMLVIYVYFVNTVEPCENNYAKIAKLLMYLAMTVTMQMLFQVYSQGDNAIWFIEHRRIDLGWENLNIIIYVNLMALPLIGYLVTKVKFKVPYLLFAIFVIIGILLTLSRSSILSVGIYVMLLIPAMILIDKNKTWLIIQGLIGVMFIVMGIYYLEHYHEIISDVINAITSRDWTNTDNRTELLEVAIVQFKLHPIFGSGGLYSSAAHLTEFSARNYHNIIARASSLGSLGLLTLVFLFIRKTKLIMLSKSSFKWFALIMIYVTAWVNGMLQPMYFYTTYMVYLILVLVVVEVNIKDKIKGI